MASKPEKTASKEEEKTVKVAKTPADLQRIRLEKLMKKPEKPVFIPEKAEEKVPRVFNPPEFIRNIWGSSAGAGSGDFHVYRGVRRREYARQKHTKEQSEKEEKDDEYHRKVEQNRKDADQKTAKKRAKREKKKKRKQMNKKRKVEGKAEEADESESEEEDNES